MVEGVCVREHPWWLWKTLMRMETIDNRSQLWMGGLVNLVTLIKLLPAMAATVWGQGEGREEAAA